MGQINIPEMTPIQEVIVILWKGMIVLTYVGMIAAFVCLFKKTVPQFLKTLSKGAIPLSFPWIAVQIWRIILDPKRHDASSGAPIALGMLVLGLLSWIYLLRKEDRKT